MAQEANVLMGLSVKAMIFHEGKLLLLQKNGCIIGNFPAAACVSRKTLKPAFAGKYGRKRAFLSPWRLRPVSGAIRRKTASS